MAVGKILKNREDPSIHHHIPQDNPDRSYDTEHWKQSNGHMYKTHSSS